MRGIKQDTFIYISAEILSKSVTLLLMPVLTNNLTIEQFARYAYFMALYMVLSHVILFFQDISISRYSFRYGKRGSEILLKISFRLIVFISAISSLIIFFTNKFSTELIILIITSISYALYSIHLRLRQMHFKPFSYAKIQLTCILLTSTLTYIFLKQGILAEQSFFVAISISHLCLFFIMTRNINSAGNVKYSSTQRTVIFYKFVFFTGIPGLASQLAVLSRTHIDRILIYNIHAEESLANYVIGAQLGGAISIIIGAVNRAVLPYFWSALKNASINAKNIIRISLLSSLLIPLLPSVVFLIPDNFFTYVFGERYTSVGYYTAVFMLAHVILIPYHLIYHFLMYHGKVWGLSNILIISSIINFILIFLLVEHVPLKFLPFITVLSNTLMVGLVLTWFWLRELRKIVD
jgi:O-antigen/teichoic acid export membrane protein